MTHCVRTSYPGRPVHGGEPSSTTPRDRTSCQVSQDGQHCRIVAAQYLVLATSSASATPTPLEITSGGPGNNQASAPGGVRVMCAHLQAGIPVPGLRRTRTSPRRKWLIAAAAGMYATGSCGTSWDDQRSGVADSTR